MILNWTDDGDQVILMIDANENVAAIKYLPFLNSIEEAGLNVFTGGNCVFFNFMNYAS